jgi:branched-chain amino acid transport system permease protein
MTSPAPHDVSITAPERRLPRPGSPVPGRKPALRRGTPIAAACAAATCVLIWALVSPDIAQIKIVSTVLMYVALASAWNLLGGYVGYLNFGSVMFMGLGAYTTAILATTFHLNPLLMLPAAALVAAAGALLVGIPGFRLRGDYFAVATFVLTLALQQLATTLPLTGGANGLIIESPVDSLDDSVRLFCVLFLAAAVLATALCWMIERTRWLGAMVAVREDEDAAEVLGIPTLRVKLAAFVVGAAIAGLVGCLYAGELLFIEPTGTFDFQVSLAVVVAAVVGGKGTWYGPVIGAVLTQLTLQQLLVNVEGTWNQFIFGAVLVVAVLTAPRGIAGLFNKERGRRFGV